MADIESPEASDAEAVATESAEAPGEQPDRPYTFTLEVAGPCRRKLTVEVRADRVDQEFETAYKELARTVSVPGFRKGKVPRRVLERRFGKHVSEDVQHSLPHEILEEIVEAQSLVPLESVHPENVTLEQRDLKFEATFDVKPEFELGEISGLRAERPSTDTSDEEVDRILQAKALEDATWEVVDGGAAAAGDLIVGDAAFETPENGLQWDDENLWIDADAAEIETFATPGWSEACRGKSVGEVAEVAATSGDGAQGTMKVTIREIKRRTPPALNDEWAKAHSHDSLKEFREHTRSEEIKKREAEAEKTVGDALLKQVCAGLEFEIPEKVISRRLNQVRLERRYQLLSKGVSGDALSQELDALEEELRQQAEFDVRSQFVLEKIADNEKIFVTEEELDQHFQTVSERTGQPADTVRAYYEGRGMIHGLRESLRLDRAKSWLLEKSEIVNQDNP